ncbi:MULTISPECIES: DUF6313 family protein [unclassified Streptomyces]|uniref:DUF6313 family protein n=1 Tax=unclassified Streptomyces TaxID=2593676 RepID=UPI0023654DEB|nr:MULTISPECIES: DUF6313 family protein [unclassified Streptomyces]MDF3142151.1 DUF6313 family protein [Streptomyces sp. T21Q-yed]WDF43568.1 DUF6313 family protein [Streptomyces sp. T12]
MATHTPHQSRPDKRSWLKRLQHRIDENQAHAGKFEHWLKYRSWKWISVVFVLYLVAGFGIGFIDAWEILVGRESAKDAAWPGVTWPLSILGWLLVPAFIGGVAGYIVTSQIESRRVRPIKELLEDLSKRAEEANKPGGPT